MQGTQESQSHLAKEGQSLKSHTFQFKASDKATLIKTV
jgi:hypothetical protein